MKKTYGVFFGMLAMGLAALGAPATKAQSRLAAGETGTAPAPATAPAASSPADLDHRIEALESELAELRTALLTKKAEEAAAPAVTPGVSLAQDAAPAGAAPAGPEKTTIASLLGPTSISGFVDTNYQVNFNHPNGAGPNFYNGADFRFSDFRDKSINLNMIELILDKAPDPMGGAAGRTGYHVSLAYGDAMTAIDGAERLSSGSGTSSLGFDQYVKEAYFSYLAPLGSGLQVDVGKFVTPMGAEVIESKDNWNYSRGLLFTYAIPLFHFGVRAKYTFSPKYSLTGFVVNGWNNVIDNNSGKTYGFSFVSNPTKTITYTINYLIGPEAAASSFGATTAFGTMPASVNGKFRQTWDAVAMYTPNSKWSFMANYDYGRGDRVCLTNCEPGEDEGLPTLSAPVSWWGIAGYAKYSPTANDYFAARYEYYDDPDGFTATSSIPSAGFLCESCELGGPIDGIPSNRFGPVGLKNLHFNEITATYQHTLASFLLTRFEYRRDMSDFPVYAISTFSPGVKQQSTASISMIFLFDSRNAK